MEKYILVFVYDQLYVYKNQDSKTVTITPWIINIKTLNFLSLYISFEVLSNRITLILKKILFQKVLCGISFDCTISGSNFDEFLRLIILFIF